MYRRKSIRYVSICSIVITLFGLQIYEIMPNAGGKTAENIILSSPLPTSLKTNALQKAVFRAAKGGFLAGKRWPFTTQEAASRIYPNNHHNPTEATSVLKQGFSCISSAYASGKTGGPPRRRKRQKAAQAETFFKKTALFSKIILTFAKLTSYITFSASGRWAHAHSQGALPQLKTL